MYVFIVVNYNYYNLLEVEIYYLDSYNFKFYHTILDLGTDGGIQEVNHSVALMWIYDFTYGKL